MKNTHKDKTLCVRFNEEDVKLLNNIATENGTTVSDVIRTATEGQLTTYLGSVKFVDPEQGNTIKDCSFGILQAIVQTLDYLKLINMNLSHIANRIDTKQDTDKVNSLITAKNGLREQIGRLERATKEAGCVILKIIR